MDLSGCKDISIYLGTACNFDCHYCDRGYIKKIGNQRLTDTDVPGLRRFFEAVKRDGNDEFPADFLSFHGGEPFAFVPVMDRIIEEVTQVFGDFPLFVQTNGSLVLKNKDFILKWAGRLQVSISFDFLFQEESRTAIDIDSTLALLNEAGVQTQIQVVLPVDHPRVFSLDMVQAIVKLWARHRFSQINLIPMRHFRGGDKFKVIVDHIQVPQYFDAFTKFIQILYAIGINVVVDGQADGVDKHYFDNHKQIVLSPDGFIYPEYDFLEYRMEEARIGSWRDEVSLSRVSGFDQGFLLPECLSCEAVQTCGLKYWYKKFGQKPKGNCKTFYHATLLAILHAQKLKQKPNFMKWIGV